MVWICGKSISDVVFMDCEARLLFQFYKVKL